LKASDWERLLLGATASVMERVSAAGAGGERTRAVGIGAAGDRTLEADKAAEDMLLDSIGSAGRVRILSEEAGLVGDSGAKTLVVVDPLDGSSNFERGIPFYCTSVAIVEGDTMEDVTYGIVRDLVSGDAYTAVKGGGAKKNRKPIRTSGTTSPSDAVVGIDMSRGTPGLVEDLAKLVTGVKRQVHLGANALELCYLAEGRVDSFVDLRGRIRITDFAAAYLIASEAGAEITDGQGRRISPEFNLKRRFSFVASASPALHKQILQLISDAATRG
jgi:myo-inositol-1(or 4)-monophosphatase